MKENADSVDELRAWAQKQGFQIKIDPFISPCYEHNACDIISRRLPVKEMEDIIVNKKLFDINDFVPRKEIECSAGRNMAGIDASGNIFPCIVWRESYGSVINDNFSEIWKNMVLDYSNLENCIKCSNMPYCGVCPGVAKIEGKSVFCEIAENSKKIVKFHQNKECD
ncbi:SPASM domain-containing protein [Elusimicrobiota bacterium]